MKEQSIIDQLKKLQSISLNEKEREAGLAMFLKRVDQKAAESSASARLPEAVPATIGVSVWEKVGNRLQAASLSWAHFRDFIRQAVQLYSSHLMASLLVTVLVFGGLGIYSGISAKHALPDNQPMYSLKRALEKTQLTLNFSTTSRAKARVDLLARRVDELDRLVAKTKDHPEQNGKNVASAISNAQQEVDAVKKELTVLSQDLPAAEHVDALKQHIDQKVQSYQIALTNVGAGLPEQLRDEISPEVVALNSAIGQISAAIGNLIPEKTAVEGVDEGLGTESTSSQIIIDAELDFTSSNSVTSTIEVLWEQATSSSETDLSDGETGQVITEDELRQPDAVQEPATGGTVDPDATYPVFIGD